jgi:hypothetical protein
VRSTWTTGALVTLLVMTGCAANTATTVPPGTSITEAGTTSLAPTAVTTAVPTKDQAAKRYLAIVRPYNVALEQLEQAINNGQPAAKLRTSAEATATANEAQIRDLKAASWPADVRPAIEQLVAESELAQKYWRQAAQEKTRDDVTKAVVAATKHSGAKAADTIRQLLSLEKYKEGDYLPTTAQSN